MFFFVPFSPYTWLLDHISLVIVSLTCNMLNTKPDLKKPDDAVHLWWRCLCSISFGYKPQLPHFSPPLKYFIFMFALCPSFMLTMARLVLHWVGQCLLDLFCHFAYLRILETAVFFLEARSTCRKCAFSESSPVESSSTHCSQDLRLCFIFKKWMSWKLMAPSNDIPGIYECC